MNRKQRREQVRALKKTLRKINDQPPAVFYTRCLREKGTVLSAAEIAKRQADLPSGVLYEDLPDCSCPDVSFCHCV